MKKSILFSYVFGAWCLLFPILAQSEKQEPPARTRVIVTTDGEVDDRCSMVRFLLYANEWDIKGLIHSSSIHHWKGDGATPAHRWDPEVWLDKQIDAYAEAYPNLRQHDAAYPAPEYLRSQVFVGNIALEDDMREPTPGSSRIVEVLLEPDESPVWLQAWGGSNTIARALKTIQENHPERVVEVKKKAHLYLITEQDNTLKTYIRPEWPGMQILRSDRPSFEALGYGWQQVQSEAVQRYFDAAWMTANILQNHGPLCSMYEADEGGRFLSEGDSPAFLHMIRTGLRSEEDPSFGGWGGRFIEDAGIWRSTDVNGVEPHSILRWAADFQNDWAARADWCVRSVKEANHPPVVKIKGPLNQTVHGGQIVKLNAKPTSDPDGDSFTYRWWHYQEAGTASPVDISNPTSRTEASFTVPAEPGKTIHIVLEVSDDGAPPLKRWQRLVFAIAP